MTTLSHTLLQAREHYHINLSRLSLWARLMVELDTDTPHHKCSVDNPDMAPHNSELCSRCSEIIELHTLAYTQHHFILIPRHNAYYTHTTTDIHHYSTQTLSQPSNNHTHPHKIQSPNGSIHIRWLHETFLVIRFPIFPQSFLNFALVGKLLGNNTHERRIPGTNKTI